MSLYDEIGSLLIEKVIREFYSRAVVDPLISHFFFEKDVEALIHKQIAFASRLLGAKVEATKPRLLKEVHFALQIRNAHFARRQRLMKEVLEDFKLPKTHIEKWLILEAAQKNLIVKDSKTCIE